jgi:hypothetical protein
VSVERGVQVFLFVANIRHVDPLVQLLEKSLRLGTGETFDAMAAIEELPLKIQIGLKKCSGSVLCDSCFNSIPWITEVLCLTCGRYETCFL